MTRDIQPLRPRVPPRALVLSFSALAIPVAATVLSPESLRDYELLLWLLALVPAFLLAYYRGWRGVATAFAAGMALLSVSQVVVGASGVGRQNWQLLLGIVVVYLGISLGIGWVSELLHRDRVLAQKDAWYVTLVVDSAGGILYASPSAERVLGHPAEVLVGETLACLVPPEDMPAVAELLRPESGDGRSIEHRFRHADGSYRTLESVTRHLHHDPTIGGTVLTLRDVSERRELEEQLRLSERMQAVGRLAGGVAHDFNNTLTIVQGHVHFLLEELKAQDPMTASVGEIAKAADHAAALTRQLLAFSRQQVLRPRVLDLNEVVAETRSMLGRVLNESIELTTELDEGILSTMADKSQIEQVLINLAVNARDAMPSGGRLLLATENATIDEEFARAFTYPVQTGRYVRLVVTDTGQGMDAETRSHIFEPFYSTKEPGRGTGLGLSTVYGIVKQTGGYIWVESEPGEGSTFSIYLPAVDAALPAKPAPRPVQAPRGSETVLVVEDDERVRSIVRNTLLKRGYSVLEASHGADALAMATGYGRPIDLLVTDVVMPEMGGRELAQRFTLHRPDTPVLFMSGYTEEANMSKDAFGGDAFYIQKPFGPDDFAMKVRQVLDDATAGAPSA